MRVHRSIPERRTLDGVVFDSITECEHYANLKLLLRDGVISELKMQTRFDLIVNEIHIAYYYADFCYLKGGVAIVEDVKAWVKSKKTGKMLPRLDRETGMKLKLMRAIYGIEVDLV